MSQTSIMKALKPFTCEFCATYFCTLDGLRQHKRRHQMKYARLQPKKTTNRQCRVNKQYKCQFCGMHCGEYRSLQTHIQTVHKKGEHVHVKLVLGSICLTPEQLSAMVIEACKRQAAYQTKFDMRKRNSLTPFQCKYRNCNRIFSDDKTLQNHIRIHTLEKPFQCDKCRKSFACRTNLVSHQRTHTKEKPYQCGYCQMRFAHRYSHKNHIKTHTNEKPYQCEQCKRRFAVKGTLDGHMKTHTKEKPYQCQQCQKCFSVKNNLKRHMRIHTKEKPFQCDICGRSFNQRTSLQCHIRIHTKEKPYLCDLCGKAFAQLSSFNSHVKVHNKVTMKWKWNWSDSYMY